MNIEFPDEETWDSSTGMVKFPADCNGNRILCAITIEALTDHFGAERGSDKIGPFQTSRMVIEQAAEQMIWAGRIEDDGSVVLRSSDFN